MDPNLAIVLAVPEYLRLDSLSGVGTDGKAVAELLRESGKFQNLVVLDPALDHVSLKKQLSDSFELHKDAEEVVFYFSGHGGVIDGDFRFILHDYDPRHPRTTSLSNDELDTWARAVEPKLFCKLVDACQSGLPYIKDVEPVSEILETSKSQFNKCYFFYSSHQNQPSFATENLSVFTRALVEAVHDFPHDSGVTYHYLSGFIADALKNGQPGQDPFFVTQGQHTEVFVDVGPKMRAALGPHLAPSEREGEVEEDRVTGASLSERIITNAADYLEREEALRFLDELRTGLESPQIPKELAELYSLECEEDSAVSIGELRIAKWLSNNSSGQFFAELDVVEYFTDYLGNRLSDAEVSRIRAERSSSFGLMSVLGTAKMMRRQTKLGGYRLTEQASWLAMKITATPRHPNIPKFRLQVTYALGAKAIALFAAVVRMERTGWESYAPSGATDWIIEEFTRAQLKAEPPTDRLLDRLNEYVGATLDELFASRAAVAEGA